MVQGDLAHPRSEAVEGPEPDHPRQWQRDHQLCAVQPQACSPSQHSHLPRVQRRAPDGQLESRGGLPPDGNLL